MAAFRRCVAMVTYFVGDVQQWLFGNQCAAHQSEKRSTGTWKDWEHLTDEASTNTETQSLIGTFNSRGHNSLSNLIV